MPAYESRRTDDMVVATWRDVVMWVGSGEANEQEIGRLHDTLNSITPTGGKMGLLLWLPHRAAAPTGPGRARAARLFRDVGPNLTAFAVITEGGGFWASAIRSIITGLNLATRNSFAFKAFPSLDLAAPWLMEKLEMPAQRTEFVQVATELQTSLKQWDR